MCAKKVLKGPYFGTNSIRHFCNPSKIFYCNESKIIARKAITLPYTNTIKVKAIPSPVVSVNLPFWTKNPLKSLERPKKQYIFEKLDPNLN